MSKLRIALCLFAVSVAGLGIAGGGIYLFVRKDLSYDATATAAITDRRYIGDCLYSYAFKVANKTYTGAYVANDVCLQRATVKIKYSSRDPGHNTATVFGSFPPRRLEDLEIGGCVLLALGGCIVLVTLAMLCMLPCNKSKGGGIAPLP